MSGALSGLKILDFSGLLPGPFASMYFADLGAEVIHIESPTRPDLVRLFAPYVFGQSAAYNYLNRNKQSIALDLKQAESIQLIYDKIKDFDIVLEQFRPGVMQRLGLDYTTLAKRHPGLIYCSITGYGQTGDYQHRAGHDINYIALSGIAGHSGRKVNGPPAQGIQIADIAGGSMHAMIAILAAVIERQSSGLGQHIDISMTDCVASLNSMAAAASLAGAPQQVEGELLNGGSFYDYYATRDGRYLSIGSLEPQFQQGLAQALDLPIIQEKGGSLDATDREQVKQAITARIIQQDLAYWQTHFANLDLCVESVLSLDEALHSELAQQRQWLVDVPIAPHSQETVKQMACPIKFSRSKMRYHYIGQALGQGQWPTSK